MKTALRLTAFRRHVLGRLHPFGRDLERGTTPTERELLDAGLLEVVPRPLGEPDRLVLTADGGRALRRGRHG